MKNTNKITLPIFKILWVELCDWQVKGFHKQILELAAKDADKLPLVLQHSIYWDNVNDERITEVRDEFEQHDLIVLWSDRGKECIVSHNYLNLGEESFLFPKNTIDKSFLQKLYDRINLIFIRPPALPIEQTD